MSASHIRALRLRAPAKVNLVLAVLGRRSDGYHEVETILQQVGLWDDLRLEVAEEGIHLVCSAADLPIGPSALPAAEENLAYRAARLLRDLSGCRRGVRISLTKRIPIGAGLGGGSSDAAVVLWGLNRLWGLGWTREALQEASKTLGSDVPAFLGGVAALGRGRGDLLEPFPPLPPCWIVLVNPGFPLRTGWVYARFDEEEIKRSRDQETLERQLDTGISLPDRQGGLTKLRDHNTLLALAAQQGDLRGVANAMYNSLEEVVAPRFPDVPAMGQALLEAGALGAAMTGSGPTVFGLFSDETTARAAAQKVAKRGWWAAPVQVLTTPWWSEVVQR